MPLTIFNIFCLFSLWDCFTFNFLWQLILYDIYVLISYERMLLLYSYNRIIHWKISESLSVYIKGRNCLVSNTFLFAGQNDDMTTGEETVTMIENDEVTETVTTSSTLPIPVGLVENSNHFHVKGLVSEDSERKAGQKMSGLVWINV